MTEAEQSPEAAEFLAAKRARLAEIIGDLEEGALALKATAEPLEKLMILARMHALAAEASAVRALTMKDRQQDGLVVWPNVVQP